MDMPVQKLLASTPEPLIERLKENAPALIALVTSTGYSLWDEWASATEQSLKDNAVHADTLEERESARADWMALRRMRRLPIMLADMAKSLSDSQISTGSPS